MTSRIEQMVNDPDEYFAKARERRRLEVVAERATSRRRVVRFSTPSGDLSARVHGARSTLLDRAAAARAAARSLNIDDRYAAALRGKARAYDEAAEILAAIEKGRPFPRRLRWTRRWSA